MKTTLKTLAVTSALVFGASAANAAIVSPNTAGGSEVVLSIVNDTTGDSISIDLNVLAGDLALGQSYSLSSGAQTFISDAGGLAGVSYGVIAGDTSDFNTNIFQTSSNLDLSGELVANATKGTWSNSINGLINNLNGNTPTDETYGVFNSGVGSPNYLDGGHDLWQTGVSNLSNLSNGLETQQLWQYSLSGFAGFTGAQNLGLPLELTDTSLNIVPIPAAVWLFGSALMGMFGAARREKIAAFVAMLKDRMALRQVDMMA